MKAKITKHDDEGVTVEFDGPFALNGYLSSTVWWLSWERLAGVIDKALAHEDRQGDLLNNGPRTTQPA